MESLKLTQLEKELFEAINLKGGMESAYQQLLGRIQYIEKLIKTEKEFIKNKDKKPEEKK